MTIPPPFRLVAAGLALLAPPGLADQEPAPPPSVAGLAWITGHWLDASSGNLSEEGWTAPAGGSRLGGWRFVSAGRARIFGLLTITTRAGGPERRLRHLRAMRVGWEAKAG